MNIVYAESLKTTEYFFNHNLANLHIIIKNGKIVNILNNYYSKTLIILIFSARKDEFRIDRRIFNKKDLIFV